jgi:omega-6 fatty acid desaturase (delta-12 desaturase)
MDLHLTSPHLIRYLFVNMWLVMYTDLQHTDVRIPHYRGEAFEWMKGALCTMDRNYGIYNILHHHIGDTHIAHHLFSYVVPMDFALLTNATMLRWWLQV